MALTEAEELELLELEEQEAMAQQAQTQPQSSGTWLENAGQAISGAMAKAGPVIDAGQKLATGLTAMAAPTEALGAFGARGVVGAVDQLANMGGEATSEFLGKKGVSPYKAGSIGMAIANAPAMLPLGKGAKIDFSLKPLQGTPSLAARWKQMRTGVDASAFDQLRRDPGAFFLRTGRDEAGKAVGAAKEAAGINLGVTDSIKSLTPENLSKVRAPMGAAADAQDAVIEKLQAAMKQAPNSSADELTKIAGITPDEVSTSLNGINRKLSRLERSEGHGSPAFQQWSAVKSHFQNLLDQVAPGVKEANKDFSRVALRDKFMEPLPVNQVGTFSKINAFGFAPAAAGVGAILGGPAGAIATGAIAQGARSPFIAGLGTASRGLVDKLLDTQISRTVEAGSRRALITAYVERLNSGR